MGGETRVDDAVAQSSNAARSSPGPGSKVVATLPGAMRQVRRDRGGSIEQLCPGRYIERMKTLMIGR